MEALSRREEEEVEAKVKHEALKACDELVRGESAERPTSLRWPSARRGDRALSWPLRPTSWRRVEAPAARRERSCG